MAARCALERSVRVRAAARDRSGHRLALCASLVTCLGVAETARRTAANTRTHMILDSDLLRLRVSSVNGWRSGGRYVPAVGVGS
jgi:hypothetical protein